MRCTVLRSVPSPHAGSGPATLLRLLLRGIPTRRRTPRRLLLRHGSNLVSEVRSLQEPRAVQRAVGVVPAAGLDSYYDDSNAWWQSPPLLLAPSTAKPLARSSLVPLWNGLLPLSYMRGSFAAIGCSLPAGDPYVRRVSHHMATEIGASIDQGGELPWPQTRMKVVDMRTDRVAVHDLKERYRFMPDAHTDFILDGFSLNTLDQILPPLSATTPGPGPRH